MTDYAKDVRSMAQKRIDAIAYLRSRGKYILDKRCTFKPSWQAGLDKAPQRAEQIPRGKLK
jgi:hypothetical protein